MNIELQDKIIRPFKVFENCRLFSIALHLRGTILSEYSASMYMDTVRFPYRTQSCLVANPEIWVSGTRQGRIL